MTVLRPPMTCLIDHLTDADYDASSTCCQFIQDEIAEDEQLPKLVLAT